MYSDKCQSTVPFQFHFLQEKIWCTSVMSHYKCLSFSKEIYMKLIDKDITPRAVFDADVNSNFILM